MGSERMSNLYAYNLPGCIAAFLALNQGSQQIRMDDKSQQNITSSCPSCPVKGAALCGLRDLHS